MSPAPPALTTLRAPPPNPLVTGGIRGVGFLAELGGSIALGLQQQKQGRRIQKNLRAQARQVELIGILNARKRRAEGQQLLGAQIARFGNVAAGAGSALDIELRSRMLEELAALEEQLPFRIRAQELRHQGKLAKQGARGRGVRTILSGLARAVNQLDPGVADPTIERDTKVGRTGDDLVPVDYRDIAPVVSEGEILASLQGTRINAGNVSIIDLAPDTETLGVTGIV